MSGEWITIVTSNSLEQGRAEYQDWLQKHPVTEAELEDVVRIDTIRFPTGDGMRVLIDREFMAKRGWIVDGDGEP